MGFHIGDMARIVVCRYHAGIFGGVVPGMERYVGSNVTILSEPYERLDQSRPVVNVVSDVDPVEFAACICCLQKHPPKQDWQKLCNLTDTPREAEHA